MENRGNTSLALFLIAPLIGGDIYIETSPNSGTSVHVTVAFSPAAEEDRSLANGDR